MHPVPSFLQLLPTTRAASLRSLGSLALTFSGLGAHHFQVQILKLLLFEATHQRRVARW
jgi:hypothetical protein